MSDLVQQILQSGVSHFGKRAEMYFFTPTHYERDTRTDTLLAVVKNEVNPKRWIEVNPKSWTD